MNQQITRMKGPSSSVLLLLLLSADFAFTILHITKHAFVQNSSLLDIKISAYLEIYHLVKLFWAIVLFAYLRTLTRCSGYNSWILVFTFFLIDDAFLLHQKIGDLIARSAEGFLHLNFGSQSRFIELAVLALAWIFLLVIVAWAYSRSTHSFRQITKDMLLFIGALVFFGILVDLAGTLKFGLIISLFLEIIEDAGETVVFSLILWYIFLLVIRNGKPDYFLHDLLLKPRT
jgi:hypothetical protein